MKVTCILEGETYKPGDPEPDGYLAWHEWAEVQHKAGLRQVECGNCGKWQYPQQLSEQTRSFVAKSSRGEPMTAEYKLCLLCAPSDKEPT